MLREVIEYCLTPGSLKAGKAGYVYEAVAFEARARRNQRFWSPHWQICQQLVRDFVRQHQPASLIILGSGSLFEFPKEITPQLQKLMLVDQVFPRSVRGWAKHYPNVSLHELNLSDMNATVDHLLGERTLVISANILSQLAIPDLGRHLKKNLHDDRESFIRAEIHRTHEHRHMEFLKDIPGPKLLWTDIEQIAVIKNTEQVIESEKTVLMTMPEPLRTWDWNLAPAPELDRHHDLKLRMAAFLLSHSK